MLQVPFLNGVVIWYAGHRSYSVPTWGEESALRLCYYGCYLVFRSSRCVHGSRYTIFTCSVNIVQFLPSVTVSPHHLDQNSSTISTLNSACHHASILDSFSGISVQDISTVGIDLQLVLHGDTTACRELSRVFDVCVLCSWYVGMFMK